MARILIVDDSAVIRMKCSKLLVEKGHEVVEASNGVEALEKYQECKPDAVLLDIAMPLMNGMMTLREMKRIDHTARVAMVTALGQRSMVINGDRRFKGRGQGFCIVKPFREGRVLDTVQRLISNVNLELF